MAKITINEVDKSTNSAQLSTSNVVYIPGYAVKGPINVPTLCASYDKFVNMFGSAPYQYKHNQYYDGTNTSELVANAGDYEKSYTYAVELLKQGLPVMFERLYNGAGTKATSKIQFKDMIRSNLFTHSYELDEDTIDVQYKVENSSLEEDTWVLSKYVDNAWEVQTLATGDSIVESTYDSSPVVTVTYIDTALPSGSQSVSNSSNPGISNLISLAMGDTNLLNYVTINAKYPGEYGANIKISISELNPQVGYPLPTSRQFELLVNDNRYVISFKSEEDNYITKKVLLDENVDVEVTLTPSFISNNLYGIINKTSEYLSYTTSSEDEMTFAGVRTLLAGSSTPFNIISDKSLYDVSFITSGAYPSIDTTSSTIAANMLNCAATRGDALALVDMKRGIPKLSYFTIVNTAFPPTLVNGEDRNKYGTMIAPSVKVLLSSTKTKEWVSASFAYLYAFAQSIKTNPSWFAISGVTRAPISNFNDIEFMIDEGTANIWQSETAISINPIQNIRPYGYCIYGNRTLYRNIDGLIDSSFTNIRILINDVKKIVLKAISRLMFESNDNILWNNFKSLIEPTLDKMKTNRGILDYKIIRTSRNKRATVAGIIRLIPIEAVENFDITFSLEDSTVIVEE